jgi:hypothetical protein
MKNKNSMMIVAIVLIIAAAAGGFFGGTLYQKNQAPQFGMMGALGANGARGGNFAGRFGQNGQNANFRPVRGQILNMDTNSLTIKMSDGSTKLVVLSSKTVYTKTATANLSDFKSGDTVNVIGTQNPDGSVTANDVSINPQALRPMATPSQN